ncbi:major facilitator superfamily domain-containing protein 6-A isoform X2 [Parasteatoda tepidariorum]|uniref:major facilitator superfamily domain-containing protein 6-A isoform X2 n=2 Tax=Parasteatoda tepidariorum TaxID=114398 RepID=UPI001C71EAE1|nr:major facilitator superfamily domain-containing protein 6-like isoform X2 [Parasteatoda tepidariorum]
MRRMEGRKSTVNIFKKFKMSINRPLIPLKIFLFCFYGAGSFVTAFLTVHFKHHGMTLAELSTAYMISPIVQIGGTLLSGIIADKIGRSKPVLSANLAITVLTMIGIMLIPSPKYINCNVQTEYNSSSNNNVTNMKCDVGQLEENLCYKQCINESSKNYSDQTTIKKGSTSFEHVMNETIEIQNLCRSKNFTMCKCNESNGTLCSTVCPSEPDTKCYDESQRSTLSKVTILLYILWMTAYSNSYRICDVTTMHLVTMHNADYGRQRLFCMVGNVIVSVLAGYLVKITTPIGGEKNYSTAFYLFISLISFCFLVVYKLDVQVKPPGRKMKKNAAILLKNPDILVFAFVVLILGTSWNFTNKFIFWYLEEMQAPSVLLGLIPAIGALYGLPFLFTSEWWMKTIGTTKFFIIGLLGYVLYCIGYSFLKDPWMSLLLESANIVTYHLLWVAVILKSHEMAPEGLTATVISAAGSIHFQLSKTSGSLIARFVMNNFGGPAAYRFVAGMCFVVAVFYSLYLYCRNCYASQFQVLEQSNQENDEKIEC